MSSAYLDSDAAIAGLPTSLQFRTVRPYAAYALYGLTALGGHLLAIDTLRGYLLRIDPHTDNTTILNPFHVQNFLDVTGLARQGETLWLTRGKQIYTCSLSDLNPQPFLTLPDLIDGIAVSDTTLYVSSQQAGYIWVISSSTGKKITQFRAPGVGVENLTLRGEELWVCDRTEQSVYCLDRATGNLQFSVLTPFDSPTGLTFYPDSQTGDSMLYVAYASEEAYIRDDPNANPPPTTRISRSHLCPSPAFCLSPGGSLCPVQWLLD
ncbi:hypothetical protein [Neosynechococcus sphagnicola]|uniref:YncE family protein n=1 Tax=Neosynechococcus sphagnicola TaxID=1501145 RepID=UPI000A9A2B51